MLDLINHLGISVFGKPWRVTAGWLHDTDDGL